MTTTTASMVSLAQPRCSRRFPAAASHRSEVHKCSATVRRVTPMLLTTRFISSTPKTFASSSAVRMRSGTELAMPVMRTSRIVTDAMASRRPQVAVTWPATRVTRSSTVPQALTRSPWSTTPKRPLHVAM